MSAPLVIASAQELLQVVSLNEAAKRLLTRSFEINLRALNAIVQSKRSGGRLRGFDEASSQVRAWSRELHQQLSRLGGMVRDAVGLASAAISQQRLVALFAAAARQSGNAACARVLTDAEAALARHRTALRGLWRQVVGAVDELNQLGLMACVLSRSAMIEATAADVGQRAQLEELTKDFYVKSEEVVEIVRGLSASIRSAA